MTNAKRIKFSTTHTSFDEQIVFQDAFSSQLSDHFPMLSHLILIVKHALLVVIKCSSDGSRQLAQISSQEKILFVAFHA
jgi:hypothetical protein